MMSMEEMMLLEAESGFAEWNEEVDKAWGVGSEAWMTDLINEQIERDLHRKYAWY